MNRRPPARKGPSSVAIVVAAVAVVVAASAAGVVWDPKGFVGVCLVGSIFAGLLITGGK